ncbi:MAG: biotin synthase BioB [Acidimicrobiales bacterium]
MGLHRWLDRLAEAALALRPPTRADALGVLGSPEWALLDVVAAAARVRRAFFGNRVKLNYLVNIKSGLCGEDCGYCSQRRGSKAGVLRYSWLRPEAVVAEAERAAGIGAKRLCLVASGRGPNDRDLERVAGVIKAVRARCPELEVCVCLGLLGPGQAGRLKAAGADAYNHNLNTAASHYGQICTTHTFGDRAETVCRAAAAGLSPCSGVIVGVGETDEQLVDVAFDLRALRPDSVPVNFLMPFPGTPMAGRVELTPGRCLRVLALFRFVFPDVEVRIAGGRELHLRSLQALGLHIANSVFLGDYLTSEGAATAADRQMIADAGFVVEPAGEATLPPWRRPPGASTGPGTAGARPSRAPPVFSPPSVVPTVRQRGPGAGPPRARSSRPASQGRAS